MKKQLLQDTPAVMATLIPPLKTKRDGSVWLTLEVDTAYREMALWLLRQPALTESAISVGVIRLASEYLTTSSSAAACKK
jgi:hypothetical protein